MIMSLTNYRALGRSGLVVSPLALGTMTFGNHADEAAAVRILDKAFDNGINFFDTAENYPVPPDENWAGRTEEIVGRWMKTKRRDEIIMATKVCGPSHGWIKGSQRAGMTAVDRHNITRALDASLGPDDIALGRRVGEHEPPRRVRAIS